ncbi:hypothetical protein LTR36_010175 [Oleoguttula mirabilis]|uniref:Enoyl reductase (ER) domain-containing protein n=1 Tax=Oleoguttula mirabilis TaxID=1507867 RepID=A0AAV9JS65_9PEZI|nr:hypothetical protein LTR36_010175 [Oleoguttula mirabilis]
MASQNNPTYAQWTLPASGGIDALQFDSAATLGRLLDDEVNVEIRAASVNYRELVIVKGGLPGTNESSSQQGVVPGSDGAGIVSAVGSNVTNFKPGDRVVTHIFPHVPDDYKPVMADVSAGLGKEMDGTLRQYGRFHHTTLVHAPENLTFEEAATLTCSGLTAWNALFGLRGREVGQGDWVLVQGTGGVSVAALQFAVAAGATVVATTSSEAKADRLRRLGATHVVNYKTTPEWGASARGLTPDNRGFDVVVDVGGDMTLGQSVQAIRTDGIVVAAGLIGGSAEPVPMMAALFNHCTVRGIIAGTRAQFDDMVKFVEAKNVKPALDDVVFGIRDVKDAYRRLDKQAHFSKIVIRLHA